LEVLRLAARGLSNRDIAQELYLSTRTVQTHLSTIFTKMEVGSRTEAVVQALRKGWLSLDETL
jgi:DNA-binding NarL/FixJ family response regulator